MASWISHFLIAPPELVVLGMNERELRSNRQASRLGAVTRRGAGLGNHSRGRRAFSFWAGWRLLGQGAQAKQGQGCQQQAGNEGFFHIVVWGKRWKRPWAGLGQARPMARRVTQFLRGPLRLNWFMPQLRALCTLGSVSGHPMMPKCRCSW